MTEADGIAVDMKNLFAEHGSFRRLCEAYWHRRLLAIEEREIEDHTPKEILIGFKPVSAPNPLPTPEKFDY